MMLGSPPTDWAAAREVLGSSTTAALDCCSILVVRSVFYRDVQRFARLGHRYNLLMVHN